MSKTAAQVRQEFIDFFCRKHGHAFVRSSPVVPLDDPTLLFTNAGMNQFKPYFLGTETPKARRVANTQKCIRAGGKHNDLDDVGHDTYHHTFFEMLGNWSFGDYFKAEAITWAWELLVDVWGLDPERLHATYFEGDPAEGLEPDNEARDLWRKILPAQRIHPGNKKDNFWEMGDTGPCGPCSEIHIDLTPDKNGAKLVNAGDARVIEIWNLVFIQFNRAADGKLTPLPARHVDTGMGFERVTAVLQGHNNNYTTDVFVPLIQRIERLTGHVYGSHEATEPRDHEGENPPGRWDEGSVGVPPASHPPVVPPGRGDEGSVGVPPASHPPAVPPGRGDEGSVGVPPASHPPAVPPARGDEGSVGVPPASHAGRAASRYAVMRPGNMPDEACRVIADHARCLTFALTDGAVPDREGRGYVLRRILRRAVRFGWQYLDLHKPFLCDLVDTVVDVMGEAFPELKQNPQRVKEIIREEEESFERTLDRGIALFQDAANLARRHHNEIRGEDAFKLHDTYGFPIDLTQVMAEEKGLTVDIGEYERLMEQARERARAGGKAAEYSAAAVPPELVAPFGPTDDQPKYENEEISAQIRAIVRIDDHQPVVLTEPGQTVKPGDRAGVIFDRTCFYAEAGGQVGDRGVVGGTYARFDVEDTQSISDTIVHFGTLVMGNLGVGQDVEMKVDTHRRATMKNHTATHVMNWALREVLGDHVQQKGSLVDPEKTRFDFSHPKALTPEEIRRVEELVNEQIRRDLPVDYQYVPQEAALKIHGLRAVFGERYPDVVRVMSIGVPVAELLRTPENPAWRQYSIEFCGGTHLKNTGAIERFVILQEEAVAKGIRRLVATTGTSAKHAEDAGRALMARAEALARGSVEDVPAGLAELQQAIQAATLPLRLRAELNERIGELQKRVKKQQKAQAADAAETVKARVGELLQRADTVNGTRVVVGELPDVPVDQLKMGADLAKQKSGSAAVLFGVRSGAKALLLAAMTDDLVQRGIKAGELVKEAARHVNGGGGGPPTMAQAGGKSPEKLDEALEAGRAWIVGKL